MAIGVVAWMMSRLFGAHKQVEKARDEIARAFPLRVVILRSLPLGTDLTGLRGGEFGEVPTVESKPQHASADA
jgi:hypothetical protein